MASGYLGARLRLADFLVPPERQLKPLLLNEERYFENFQTPDGIRRHLPYLLAIQDAEFREPSSFRVGVCVCVLTACVRACTLAQGSGGREC